LSRVKCLVYPITWRAIELVLVMGLLKGHCSLKGDVYRVGIGQ